MGWIPPPPPPRKLDMGWLYDQIQAIEDILPDPPPPMSLNGFGQLRPPQRTMRTSCVNCGAPHSVFDKECSYCKTKLLPDIPQPQPTRR